MRDNLMNIRNLPKNILLNLGRLIVNRIGGDPHANMITRDIMGYFQPGKAYQLINHSHHGDLDVEFREVSPLDAGSPAKRPDISTPPAHACLSGRWISEESIVETDANILGGLGRLLIDNQTIEIPVVTATRENLAYYNASLLAIGDTLCLESEENLPVTLVHVGKNYVSNYLTQQQYGGGEYIEYHDQPHFWMPRAPHCSGHILLGRQEKESFHFTGFRIPFGFAVYMSPYTLHSDAYLVGDFIVVYTISKKYSTVVVRDKNSALKPIQFVLDGVGA
ncbi:hypothetical protein [Legionella sp. CNM-4043-24]|uniref:hypothetical protein n=1 Tax=Legionella sp. CNM-4043-24 TaxID=3421646 RepID=UPI00403B0FAF